MADSFKAFGALAVPMDRLAGIQGEYLKNATEMWNQALHRLQGDGQAAQPLPDRRFAGNEWAANPVAATMAQLYLLNARTLMTLADSVEGDAKTKARIRFAVQQWVDATSPSNYLALNPEALKKAIETQGESIGKGLQHLLDDVRKGHVSQTDESVFEVGRNVATTAGEVVFENDLFQLIEYR
ncbi:MAG: class I poly(R)-hydroxyalkanoic acid synthase, partial [Betaproteobacteria bacterium]